MSKHIIILEKTLVSIQKDINKIKPRFDKLATELSALQGIKSDIERALGREADIKSNGAPTPDSETLVLRKEGSVTPLSPEAVAIGLQLGEPFTASDLAAIMPTNAGTNAYNWLARWKQKGWIDKTSFGEYKRGVFFGKEM